MARRSARTHRTGSYGSGPNGLVSQINVTPFVDVLLVLLALTIVFASDVPGSRNAATDQVAGALGEEFDDSQTVTLELAPNGTIVLAGQVTALDRLPLALTQLRSDAQAELVLNITAHKTVAFETLFGVLQTVNASKAAGVTFSLVE